MEMTLDVDTRYRYRPKKEDQVGRTKKNRRKKRKLVAKSERGIGRKQSQRALASNQSLRVEVCYPRVYICAIRWPCPLISTQGLLPKVIG